MSQGQTARPIVPFANETHLWQIVIDVSVDLHLVPKFVVLRGGGGCLLGLQPPLPRPRSIRINYGGRPLIIPVLHPSNGDRRTLRLLQLLINVSVLSDRSAPNKDALVNARRPEDHMTSTWTDINDNMVQIKRSAAILIKKSKPNHQT